MSRYYRTGITQVREDAGENRCAYLVPDGWEEGVEARGQEHASSEAAAEPERASVPAGRVAVHLVARHLQQAHWDQHAGQHEAEHGQQAQDLQRQHVHISWGTCLCTLPVIWHSGERLNQVRWSMDSLSLSHTKLSLLVVITGNMTARVNSVKCKHILIK